MFLLIAPAVVPIARNAAQIKPPEPIGIKPISTWWVVMRVTRKLPQMIPRPSVAA